MNMKKTILSAMTIVGTMVACTTSEPKLGKSSIDDIIAAMTIEEKAHIIIGTGMDNQGDTAVVGNTKHIIPGAAGTTSLIERLGITSMVLADGPAGLRINPQREGVDRTFFCTHFPIGTLLASTWNQELVEQVGQAIGNEVLEYGVDVLLAPGLNIHRNPLCGRNFEYYSEDPLVTGKIASAYVRGVQSNGVGVSLKHFAANNQESNRMANDARMSTRALREIYLKGFEIAVKEAKPWTIMTSYNHINGTYTSENKDLLLTILRNEWGFDGTVMTDWYSGNNVVAQTEACNDMIQPGTDRQFNILVDAIKNGNISEDAVNQNVKRILQLVTKTPRFKGYQFSNNPDLKAHAQVTRQSATEGMVLLKNNNTLPLSKEVKNVALFGCTSYLFIAGGTGSGNVNRAYTVSLLDGLTNNGYNVDSTFTNTYQTHIDAENERNHFNSPNAVLYTAKRPVELIPDAQKMKVQAEKTDIAIVTIGRNSGEFLDRTVADFSLSSEEQQLVSNVCKTFHAAGKKVIVILNVGGVIETASWKDQPDAILLAWQPGQEGGNSIVDVLNGTISPSGKLPMTFPINFTDHASSANFPIEARPTHYETVGAAKTEVKNWDYTNYEEDIYVGYRYFDSFEKEVSFPFGYGLSYSTFEYSNIAVKSNANEVSVSFSIKNTGTVAAKEVAQLYISAPNAKSNNKPEKELKAFAKTTELKPGESQTITLTVKTADLASFNSEASAWQTDAGTYKILVGASSRDIRLTSEVEVDALEAKVNNVLNPQVELNLLKR